jgi:hypothetical protein
MAFPVSLEDAKIQLRYGGAEQIGEDRTKEITGYIADAAAWVQRYTGHLLVAVDVTEQFRVPPRAIELRAWPVKPSAVPTITIDAIPAMSGARLDVTSRPARILPALRTCWSLSYTDQLLTVSIRAGYEDDDEVPGDIRRAMLVLIAAYDADREGGDLFAKAEMTAKSLCRDLRLKRL